MRRTFHFEQSPALTPAMATASPSTHYSRMYLKGPLMQVHSSLGGGSDDHTIEVDRRRKDNSSGPRERAEAPQRHREGGGTGQPAGNSSGSSGSGWGAPPSGSGSSGSGWTPPPTGTGSSGGGSTSGGMSIIGIIVLLVVIAAGYFLFGGSSNTPRTPLPQLPLSYQELPPLFQGQRDR